MPIDQETLITLTADIVSAHVSNNSVGTDDVTRLIQSVYGALEGAGAPPAPTKPEKPKGAVSARASIKPDHLISMIDGKPYKLLKRHLSLNGYTPESYRETFDLPVSYPMVAASYAEKRRDLAKKIGLGRKPGVKLAKASAKPGKAAAAKKAAPGRPRKAAAAKPVERTAPKEA